MSLKKSLAMWQIGRTTKVDKVPPSEVVKVFIEHFEKLPVDSQDDQAAILRTLDFFNNGHLTASLNYATDKLHEFMDDPPFVQFYRKHLNAVLDNLLDNTAATTQSPEFISAYERLIELGESSFELHFCAIHNYANQGRPREALHIAQRLARVAPNYPGLKEALTDLKTAEASWEKKQ